MRMRNPDIERERMSQGNPTRCRSLPLIGLMALLLAGFASEVRAGEPAAAPAPPGAKRDTSDEAMVDYKANDMLNRGLELLELKQEDRALSLLSSIPRMFPKSRVRFAAALSLGKYQMGKRRYELAIRQFNQLEDSEDQDQQAEGIYQAGICHYNLNDFEKAFMSLRKVTNEFPWSVYANEAYYYIGQCHFKLGRWAKAVEALEKVGTSVPPSTAGDAFGEAGQRLFVKVYDRDLVVLLSTKEKVKVQLATKSGDKEEIALEPQGRSGELYLGAIMTVPGEPKPGDRTLQIIGGDSVSVDYLDVNTESGKRNEKRLATVKMVSTASLGFTDGAYREYTKGIFGDQDAFIRLKDLDRDVSNERDTVTVKVYTQRKVEKEVDVDRKGVDMAEKKEEEYELRDSVEVKLVETGPHTGIFVGTVVPRVVASPEEIRRGDNVLSAMKGDDIVVEYLDEAHMLGREPRVVKAQAKLLIGQIQDVKIEHREVESIEVKARKSLIEAKIFLKLGQIFKEVGLTKKANEKGDEGLDRAEEVIRTSLKASLDRSIVEEAFSVKWELLLVQDKLPQAIGVCRTLMELFPDSTLVDRALLKIGLAKSEGENPGEAIGIFNAVINLPKSDLKAMAQYQIGLVQEKTAAAQAKNSGTEPDLSQAMMSYKKCSEAFPDSPYAGEALDKIVGYYINVKDYRHAMELMERVFQDYPDGSFLDKMLLKWCIAAYRVGNLPLAKVKAEQLLSEYPSSTLASKARKFQEIIDRKMSGKAPAEGGGGEE